MREGKEKKLQRTEERESTGILLVVDKSEATSPPDRQKHAKSRSVASGAGVWVWSQDSKIPGLAAVTYKAPGDYGRRTVGGIRRL